MKTSRRVTHRLKRRASGLPYWRGTVADHSNSDWQQRSNGYRKSWLRREQRTAQRRRLRRATALSKAALWQADRQTAAATRRERRRAPLAGWLLLPLCCTANAAANCDYVVAGANHRKRDSGARIALKCCASDCQCQPAAAAAGLPKRAGVAPKFGLLKAHPVATTTTTTNDEFCVCCCCTKANVAAAAAADDTTLFPRRRRSFAFLGLFLLPALGGPARSLATASVGTTILHANSPGVSPVQIYDRQTFKSIKSADLVSQFQLDCPSSSILIVALQFIPDDLPSRQREITPSISAQ